MNVVVLSDLFSVLNPSSFVFIVDSSSVFFVSILVLSFLLSIIFSGCWLYGVAKEDIFLYWESSVEKMFLLSSWILSEKIWNCFSKFAPNLASCLAMLSLYFESRLELLSLKLARRFFYFSGKVSLGQLRIGWNRNWGGSSGGGNILISVRECVGWWRHNEE